MPATSDDTFNAGWAPLLVGTVNNRSDNKRQTDLAGPFHDRDQTRSRHAIWFVQHRGHHPAAVGDCHLRDTLSAGRIVVLEKPHSPSAKGILAVTTRFGAHPDRWIQA